jgi:uncharacterized protein YdeI (YjbR/CyaY-like superfamily)
MAQAAGEQRDALRSHIVKTFVAETADQWRQWLDKPAAWRYFEGLAPSHRRRYVGWIESAKREDTKIRRLQEAIRLLTAGRPLGLK